MKEIVFFIDEENIDINKINYSYTSFIEAI